MRKSTRRIFATCFVLLLILASPATGTCQPSHEAFHEQIKSRQIADLFSSLCTHDNGYFDVVEASAMQPSFSGKPVVPISAVLSDKRVKKIFEELQGMEASGASQLVQSQLMSSLGQYKKKWEDEEGRLFEYERYGLTALLFLSLTFCDDEVFDEACSDWSYWYYLNQSKGRDFSAYAGPDTLSLVNFYAIASVKNGKSVDTVNREIGELCEQMGIGKLPVLTLNKLMRFEVESSPNESGDVLIEVPVIQNWGQAGVLASSAAPDLILSARCVSKARSWVRPSNVVTQWMNSQADHTLESLENTLRQSGY